MTGWDGSVSAAEADPYQLPFMDGTAGIMFAMGEAAAPKSAAMKDARKVGVWHVVPPLV